MGRRELPDCGSPHNPLSDAELEEKCADCAGGLLDAAAQKRLLAHVWSIEQLADVGVLFEDLGWHRG